MISKLLKARRARKIHERRMEQMKQNPWRRVDSESMTQVQKMDKGFNGKTYSINGMDVDF